jgi:predicted transcriptional regulator
MKPYIQEVLRKASINKASKIYEHGISLGQTAQLLGITQWELSEYSGQTNVSDNDYNKTLDIKKRAKMALEFFS